MSENLLYKNIYFLNYKKTKNMYFNTLLTLTFSLLMLFMSICGMAQNGASDVRFLIHSLDCVSAELCFDVQLRAAESDREFYLTEQNYRFSFNGLAMTQPYIAEELGVSGLITSESGQGFSLYSEHNTFGSLDTVFSYNVELAGGDGMYVAADEYISVGRLCTEILDFNEPLYLQWHTESIFPVTFIGGYDGYESDYTELVSMLSYHQDLSGVCENVPPIAVNDVAEIDANGQVTICLSENDTDADNKLDIASIQLLNMPPASEGTISLDAETGCINFVAAQGFTGVSTFEYQICDEGKSIPSYRGNLNTEPIAEPDPQDPDILVTAPACDVAKVSIGVGTSVGLVAAENDAALFNLTAFPNPADETVNISYTLTQKSEVSIALWNVIGQAIQQLSPETLQTGTHIKMLNVDKLNKGNYLLVLNINEKTATKMIQIK